MEVGMALAKGSKNLTNNLYHSIVSNRIEKYNIAQEMGVNAPKATLSSWNSIVKWQKNELEIIRNRYKSLSNNLLKEQNKLRSKTIKASDKKTTQAKIERIKEDLDDVSASLNQQENLYAEMLIKIDNIYFVPTHFYLLL